MWTPEAIRKLRRELGWTQLELGSYLGVGKTAACNWERGRCPPSRLAADGLSALADVAASFSGSNGNDREAPVRPYGFVVPLFRAEEWSAERVRALRERCGWLQYELAEALGVVPPAVSTWESGAHRPSGRVRRLLTMLEADVKAHPPEKRLTPAVIHPHLRTRGVRLVR